MGKLIELNLVCRHEWIKVGIWSDRVYRCHPLFRCAKCGQEKYEQ